MLHCRDAAGQLMSRGCFPDVALGLSGQIRVLLLVLRGAFRCFVPRSGLCRPPPPCRPDLWSAAQTVLHLEASPPSTVTLGRVLLLPNPGSISGCWRPLCSLGPSMLQKCFCIRLQICGSRQFCLRGLRTIPRALM